MVSRAFILALAIRSLSLLHPHTFFQPDEFYQALEPAHHLVFGSGHLTWEWKDLPRAIAFGGEGTWWAKYVEGGRMRGWLWPGIFSLVYKALDLLGLDQTFLLVSSYFPSVVFSVVQRYQADMSDIRAQSHRGTGSCYDRLSNLSAILEGHRPRLGRSSGELFGSGRRSVSPS